LTTLVLLIPRSWVRDPQGPPEYAQVKRYIVVWPALSLPTFVTHSFTYCLLLNRETPRAGSRGACAGGQLWQCPRLHFTSVSRHDLWCRRVGHCGLLAKSGLGVQALPERSAPAGWGSGYTLPPAMAPSGCAGPTLLKPTPQYGGLSATDGTSTAHHPLFISPSGGNSYRRGSPPTCARSLRLRLPFTPLASALPCPARRSPPLAWRVAHRRLSGHGRARAVAAA